MPRFELLLSAATKIQAGTTLPYGAALEMARTVADAADDDGIAFDAAMLAEVALDMHDDAHA